MPLLSAGRGVGAPPPQLQLPLGLSFYDSFVNGCSYAPVSLPTDTGPETPGPTRSREGSRAPHRISRKPVASTTSECLSRNTGAVTPVSATRSDAPLLEKSTAKTTARIYWLIPTAAILLFLLGFMVAVCHYLYLQLLNKHVINNQVWIYRYSLAMAFIVKACLVAAISLAFTQKIWHTLQGTRRGISISGIDALFAVDASPLMLCSWEMWRTACVPAIMALFIWLMPLITLVSPTALTVGSSLRSSNNHSCLVPTLNLTDLPKVSPLLSLFDIDYEGIQFETSFTARNIIDQTSQNGRQIVWSSPCGSDCSYNISFAAPSWRCNRTDDIDNPSAPWTPGTWYGDYGDGSNVTASDVEIDVDLEYGSIYIAGYNNETTQFWVGVTDRVNVSTTSEMSIKDFLDLHVYRCDFINTAYHVRVSYTNHQQSTEIIRHNYISDIQIPAEVWGGGINGDTPDAYTIAVASLYSYLVGQLQGTISRDPREIIRSNTNLASIPTLVHDYTGQMGVGQEDPYIPNLKLGPLLEELSRNISISLISQQRLDTTAIAITTCATYKTLTVWIFHPSPLVFSYSLALIASILSLIVGGQALFASGVARDKSFSSIVRSTRNQDLDLLSTGEEDLALPLPQCIGKQRLRFSGLSTGLSGVEGVQRKRMSFLITEEGLQTSQPPEEH